VRRALALLGVAVALLVGAQAAPAVAAPLPIGDCTTSSGAILAVDFSHWGGPVLRACGTANGSTDTGYQLLNQGGWRTQGTVHDGPAFICRIGYAGYQGGAMYPTAAQEDCNLTPPATAYWSYWHADPGQNSWTYSNLGAMLYKPKPGSVDLWIFGATNIQGTEGLPTFSPDAVRAHNTTAQGGVQPGGPTGPVNTQGVNPGPPPVKGGNAPLTTTTAPPATTTTTAPPSTTPPACPTTTTTPDTTTPDTTTPDTSGNPCPATTPASASQAGDHVRIQDAQPRAAVTPSAGSPVPLLIGLGIVLVLGAGGGLFAWRRRRG
jgi:hypothetical protein